MLLPTFKKIKLHLEFSLAFSLLDSLFSSFSGHVYSVVVVAQVVAHQSAVKRTKTNNTLNANFIGLQLLSSSVSF